MVNITGARLTYFGTMDPRKVVRSAEPLCIMTGFMILVDSTSYCPLACAF